MSATAALKTAASVEIMASLSDVGDGGDENVY